MYITYKIQNSKFEIQSFLHKNEKNIQKDERIRLNWVNLTLYYPISSW